MIPKSIPNGQGFVDEVLTSSGSQLSEERLISGSGDQRQNAMLMIRLARYCTLHHDIV